MENVNNSIPVSEEYANDSAIECFLNQMYIYFVQKFNGDKEKAKKAVDFIVNHEQEQEQKYNKTVEFYKDAVLVESKARKPYGDYREFNEEITRYLYGYGGEIKNDELSKIFNIDQLFLKKKEVYSIFVDKDEQMYFSFYENNKLYKQIFYVNMLNDERIEKLDDYLFNANNDNEFGELMVL